MSTVIFCPQCRAELKVKEHPAPPKKVRCPRCSQPFTLGAASVAVAPAPNRARFGSPESPEVLIPQPTDQVTPNLKPSSQGEKNERAGRWLALAIAASLVLLILGFGTILVFLWPWGGLPPEKPAAPPPVAAVTPPVQKPAPLPVKPTPTTEKESAKEKEPKADNEQERELKQKEYTRLMIKAARDVDGGRFEEAIASYEQGLKLFPKDADAQLGLEQALAKLAEQRKAQEKEKSKENVAILLKQGQEALKNNQPAAAVEIFKLVLEKAPGETAAVKGLADAKEALARDQQQQMKQAEFARHLAAGKAAYAAGRYADAIRDFIAAQQALPGNPEAAALRRQAEARLEAVQNQEEKQKEFDRLLARAGEAQKNRRYDEAEQYYRDALKLFPKDEMARKGLEEARSLGQQARASFTRAMNRGQLALRDGRYLDAISAFREAVRLQPNDETARKALRDAEQTQERLLAYNEAMHRALAAMALKRYADAAQAYSEALRLVPGDFAASQGLRDANARLQRQVDRLQEFDKKVQQGQAALLKHDYPRAAQLLTEALEMRVNAANLAFVQSRARFANAMVQGNEAMKDKNYQEAVRQFQNALQESPTDSAAIQALARARSLSGIPNQPNSKDKKSTSK